MRGECAAAFARVLDVDTWQPGMLGACCYAEHVSRFAMERAAVSAAAQAAVRAQGALEFVAGVIETHRGCGKAVTASLRLLVSLMERSWRDDAGAAPQQDAPPPQRLVDEVVGLLTAHVGHPGGHVAA